MRIYRSEAEIQIFRLVVTITCGLIYSLFIGFPIMDILNQLFSVIGVLNQIFPLLQAARQF